MNTLDKEIARWERPIEDGDESTLLARLRDARDSSESRLRAAALALEDPALRLLAAEALRHCGAAESAPALLRGLRDRPDA